MMPALAAEGTPSCAGETEFPQGLKPTPYERVTARRSRAPSKMSALRVQAELEKVAGG